MSANWQIVVISLWVVALLQTFLVLVLFHQVGVVFLGQSPARARDGLPLGARTPNWEAPDETGVTRRAEDFRGRPTMILFADPFCGPCQHLMPELAAFAQEVGDRLVIVVVGSEDHGANAQMADRYLLAVPVVTQQNRSISGAFEVAATPFAFFADGSGRVRAKGVVNSLTQLRRHAESVLGQSLEKDQREGVIHEQPRAAYR